MSVQLRSASLAGALVTTTVAATAAGALIVDGDQPLMPSSVLWVVVVAAAVGWILHGMSICCGKVLAGQSAITQEIASIRSEFSDRLDVFEAQGLFDQLDQVTDVSRRRLRVVPSRKECK